MGFYRKNIRDINIWKSEGEAGRLTKRRELFVMSRHPDPTANAAIRNVYYESLITERKEKMDERINNQKQQNEESAYALIFFMPDDRGEEMCV